MPNGTPLWERVRALHAQHPAPQNSAAGAQSSCFEGWRVGQYLVHLRIELQLELIQLEPPASELRNSATELEPSSAGVRTAWGKI